MKSVLRLFALATIAVASTLFTLSASAATTLRIATWLAPTHPMNAEVFPIWSEWVEEATEGRVKVKLEYDLGHPRSYFDLVEDGVADAGWSLHAYVPGRFVLTELSEMPMTNATAEATSVAYWRINEQYLSKAGEHEGITLLGLFTEGAAALQLRKPVETLDDLKGLKIRAPGGIASQIGHELGVTNVSAPAPKVYELLQQGVVDGVMIAPMTQKSLRLNEVISQMISVPGGVFRGSFSFFASEDFLDGLSSKDRNAILSISGEKFSAMAGRVWEQANIDGFSVASESGVSYTEADQATPIYQTLDRITSEVRSDWVKKASSRGVDGQKVLDEYLALATGYTNSAF
ncbi:C4-dicarboxylate ABC transporter substrate-binding protein [Endozoicomonas montiporae]|uniref:C4-dicarboxylate ABC transporter substrate-binding protein n=2 Tax=Endozoicomonas montiporae TaxID=1027273 RepID=A0A081MZK5_9GAMM|nr:TRAP transporter substrate-binding protein [Endozoicomonas montiporae]AMO54690.1 TRAP dicarboxylate transporter subunit DctP [Endozoicomonas montiporae CL-33]KEQ11628.1 C4-dicarboxylate ABC transporter substrate-binding protein [Endozoicomonas montiporae]